MAFLLKIKGYLIALGSFLLALIGTYLWAKHSGKDQGEQDQKVADAQATTDAIKEQINTRTDVEMQVNDLPKPKAAITITVPAPIPMAEGAQQVGSAETNTSAGDLRAHWMRDGES